MSSKMTSNLPVKVDRLRLPADPPAYHVGYAKPPVEHRFQKGRSGNPKGRPRGAGNKPRRGTNQRISELILHEAYRTIPVLEMGKRRTIPVMTAVLRALAANAAKGNTRAASLLTSLVKITEDENHQRASEMFRKALDYKELWTKELERRKRLGLQHPDPIPHPDDIVIDPRRMSVRIAGPMTKDEVPRYRLAGLILEVYQEIFATDQARLASMADGPERTKLAKKVSTNQHLIDGLTRHYGPRHERIKDPIIRDLEELVGVPFELDDDDDDDDGGETAS